jgi:transcription elongation factor Elf1
MDTELRPCPLCAFNKPVVVTIAGESPVYIVACPECGASGPKQLPGVAVEVAVNAWNRRYGIQ